MCLEQRSVLILPIGADDLWIPVLWMGVTPEFCTGPQNRPLTPGPSPSPPWGEGGRRPGEGELPTERSFSEIRFNFGARFR